MTPSAKERFRKSMFDEYGKYKECILLKDKSHRVIEEIIDPIEDITFHLV